MPFSPAMNSIDDHGTVSASGVVRGTFCGNTALSMVGLGLGLAVVVAAAAAAAADVPLDADATAAEDVPVRCR